MRNCLFRLKKKPFIVFVYFIFIKWRWSRILMKILFLFHNLPLHQIHGTKDFCVMISRKNESYLIYVTNNFLRLTCFKNGYKNELHDIKDSCTMRLKHQIYINFRMLLLPTTKFTTARPAMERIAPINVLSLCTKYRQSWRRKNVLSLLKSTL